MAVEDFALCYMNRVGGDVDTVVKAVERIGIDGIRNLVAAAVAVGGSVTVATLAGPRSKRTSWRRWGSLHGKASCCCSARPPGR